MLLIRPSSSLLVYAAVAACSSGARDVSRGVPVPAPRASIPDAGNARQPQPPAAARRPHEISSPHGTRADPYYWMRDDTRANGEVLAYLAAENAYAEAVLAPARGVEDAIVAETRARMQDDDLEPAVLEDGYWYYVRHAAGQQHPIHARRKGSMAAPEEIVLDGNDLAMGHAYYAVGDFAVSRDGKLLAWTDDTVGRLQFTLHVKNLETGEALADTATGVAPSVVWANDNVTLFYVGKDATTLREDRVMRHRLGGTHDIVYREADAGFYVDIRALKSRRYLAIELDETTHSETRLIDANKPEAAPSVFIQRATDHIYEIEHVQQRFVMRTNEAAENYRVVEVPARNPSRRKGWRDVIPHREDAFVSDFVAYDSFVAVSVRIGGLARIEIVAGKRPARLLDGSDPTYAMALVDTPDAAATRVRYTYDSLTTPSSTYDHDVAAGERQLVHRDPAPSYVPERYTSEYLRATALDGTRVPVSIVYRKDTKRDGSAPLLVTGYGAYGDSTDPRFDRTRVSLLDRGWVFAIAHVRGGHELGDAWYDAGRALAKQNTFADFIAVTELLVREKYAAKDRVFAEGASAGGLVIGVIANMRPELYRGLIAWVPFVDVVTTMLDESIPLVTNEYEEWGNPRANKAAYEYMLAYSPYDNVRAQAYPAMYVRTGLHDSQVQYYEPAKWVAKLRATKIDDNLLVLETDMSAGHGGKSGRFDAIREQARAYAFMMLVLGGAGAVVLR